MRRTPVRILALALLLLAGLAARGQERVSILGDSYSTFEGYVSPAANLVWYTAGGQTGRDNDVVRVEQTWWHLFIDQTGRRLERNNSYSGSTVCLTGYRGEEFSDRAFITRIHNLGDPDLILLFGGTNDSWAGVPVGEFRYEGWTKADLYAFRPAFCYLLHQLRELYPEARICNICNSELSEEITASMEAACRRYGILNVLLHDIDKQTGHPSVAGMRSICAQLREAVDGK